jgi:hypothetical protein
MTRDDKEFYLAILFVYIWLLIYFPYTWFSTVPYRLDAIDKVIWAIAFLLATDLTYCNYKYGLVLDLKRDFNFWASMVIIGLIVGFFVMLVFFW